MRPTREETSWLCGPPSRPDTYRIDDIAALLTGQHTVVRAERGSSPDDPIGYDGPAAVKVVTRADGVHADDAVHAATIARLHHPNLGRPLEVFDGTPLHRGGDGDGDVDGGEQVRYIVSVWEDGPTLAEIAPLPPRTAIAVGVDLAGAMLALHDAGLLYRDTHPGNVIVRPDGSAVLIDFGSVIDMKPASAPRQPLAGVVGFVPPERIAGSPDSRASDAWGVGMLTVFALLGHPQGSMSSSDLAAELDDALSASDFTRSVRQALRSITSPDPSDRPALADWRRTLQSGLLPGHSLARRFRMAIALALLSVSAVGIWLAVRDAPADDTAGPDAAHDPAAVLEPCTDAVAAAAERVDVGGECLAHSSTLAQSTVHELQVDGHHVGVVIEPPGSPPVHLTPAMWSSYRELAGRGQPLNSVEYGGYPTAVTYRDDPAAVVVSLSRGGLMVGPRDDSQLFWIPRPGVSIWEGTGGAGGELGFPMSNPRVLAETVVLEFEHEELSVPAEHVAALLTGADVPITRTVVDSAPPSIPAGGAIIRHWSGVTWWVDDDGIRHWIPDGGTWECLGGSGATAADELAGWDIAPFPIGEPARCP